MQKELANRVVVNPEVMAGKPIIKGTRIPVDLIIKLVGQGMALEEILDDYPKLTQEDIQAALLYGSEVVANEEVFPLIVGES